MAFGDIVGVVLAGGRGRRMGGGDKGLVAFGQSALASVAVRRLQAQTCAVIINANRNFEEYHKLGCKVVGDAVIENTNRGDDNKNVDDNRCQFAGPLAGMLAGMRAAAGEWVLFVPCDCPFFPATLAADLAAGANNNKADIAVAVANGRAQPVFMLARRNLADDLAAFIGGGGRKIDLWYARHRYAEVQFADSAAFDNINTPEDLAAAQKRL